MIKYLADNAETVAQIEHLHEFENLMKVWKCAVQGWVDMGGEVLPSNKVTYSNLIWFIPLSITERIGDESLTPNKNLKEN